MAGIEVINQRYIIPIEVFVLKNKLRFKNLSPDNLAFTQQDNFLYLPEKQGEVDLQDIFNAILASSAFPVIFSPIELHYCKATSQATTDSIQKNCPSGYREQFDYFIDGGNFDNAPIGAAMKISDPTEQYLETVIIFVNPENKRGNRSTPLEKVRKQRNNSQFIFGIRDYVDLAYHIFDYGMSTELYQSARSVEKLQQVSGIDRPSIYITDRHHSVVGDYLMHFGAFFDKAFREYDFYVGVYDGVINLAKNKCKRYSSIENRNKYLSCIGEKAKNTVSEIGISDEPAFELIQILAKHEFNLEPDSNNWQWLNTKKKRKIDINKLLTIYQSMNKIKWFDNSAVTKNSTAVKNSFSVFLANLKQADPTLSGFESYTKQLINEKMNWQYSLVDNAISRLYDIEQEKTKLAKRFNDNDGKQSEIFNLLKMSTYVGKTYFLKRSTGLWPNSTLENSSSSIQLFIPDEIGISYRQTSVYLKYKYETKLIKYNTPIGFETRFIPIDWASRTRKVNKIIGAEFVLKTHLSNPLISTLGIGYGYYNVDFYSYSPNGKVNSFTTPLHGLIIDLGAIAGKIKISFVYRGKEINSDQRGYVNWAINLGLCDIKGLSWLW